MTAVVGVDLSLTATGLARVSPGHASVSTAKTTGHRADEVWRRNDRLLAATLGVKTFVHAVPTELVVVEGPAIVARGGSNWDRAGLWWRVVGWLLEQQYQVAVMSPSSVKLFAAGKGNADKATVAVGMSRLWPDVTGSSDNEWDALCLATAGAQWLGWDVPRRAHHERALAKVEWPTTGKAAA